MAYTLITPKKKKKIQHSNPSLRSHLISLQFGACLDIGSRGNPEWKFRKNHLQLNSSVGVLILESRK